MIELDFIVIAIHGEGDRTTVNALQQHRNDEEVLRLQRSGGTISDALTDPPDEPPDVLVILRDQYHNFRMEIPAETWDDVEEWKKLAGWDQDKRHWKTGAILKVQISS